MQLEQEEKVIKKVRKHWLVFVLSVLFLLILFIIPIIVYIITPDVLVRYLPIAIAGNGDVLFVYLYVLWTLFITFVFFSVWTDYYLDVWVITDRRIVDIEQKGFFKRETSSFRLDRIQDVTIEINGFVATMLGYGDIHVQTAGESRNFTIQNASHPEGVKQMILEAHNKAVSKRYVGGGL